MGNDSYKYQVDERKKYQKIEAVEDKWIRIHKDFSPYVDEHILFRCMKEAFNLVDIVMGNKIYGFKNANTPANTEKTDKGELYFYDNLKDPINYTEARTFYGKVAILKRLGYAIPDEINEIRKFRNFIEHNTETFNLQYFAETYNYDKAMELIANLGYTLYVLGMLRYEYIIPAGDILLAHKGDYIGNGNEYYLHEIISSSVFCNVFLGYDVKKKKYVAIKEIKQYETLDNDKDLLMHMNCDNLPHVLDIINYNRTFYIVMEYIEGVSLTKVLNEGVVTYDCAVYMIRQIAKVIDYLHSQHRMVHVELNPDNFLVDMNWKVYLVDFGVTKSKEYIAANDTSSIYIAPEVIEGGVYDQRADIYTFGMMVQVILRRVQDSAEHEEELSRLFDITRRCVGINPYNRYSSANEVCGMLYEIGHSRMAQYENMQYGRDQNGGFQTGKPWHEKTNSGNTNVENTECGQYRHMKPQSGKTGEEGGNMMVQQSQGAKCPRKIILGIIVFLVAAALFAGGILFGRFL